MMTGLRIDMTFMEEPLFRNGSLEIFAVLGTTFVPYESNTPGFANFQAGCGVRTEKDGRTYREKGGRPVTLQDRSGSILSYTAERVGRLPCRCPVVRESCEDMSEVADERDAHRNVAALLECHRL